MIDFNPDKVLGIPSKAKPKSIKHKNITKDI